MQYLSTNTPTFPAHRRAHLRPNPAVSLQLWDIRAPSGIESGGPKKRELNEVRTIFGRRLTSFHRHVPQCTRGCLGVASAGVHTRRAHRTHRTAQVSLTPYNVQQRSDHSTRPIIGRATGAQKERACMDQART